MRRLALLLFALCAGSAEAACLGYGARSVDPRECVRGSSVATYATRPTLARARGSTVFVTDCTTTACTAGGGSILCALRAKDDGSAWEVGLCQSGATAPLTWDATNDAVNESTALGHVECDGLGLDCGTPSANQAQVKLKAGTYTQRVGGLVFDIPAGLLATQEFTLRLAPWAGTATRVDCEAYGGTSFTIKVCYGEDRGDDTCATNLLDATEATTLVCDTTGASDTALNAATFAARDKITVVVTAVSGAVTQGEVYLTGTVD